MRVANSATLIHGEQDAVLVDHVPHHVASPSVVERCETAR
jgi:hypothetical protein